MKPLVGVVYGDPGGRAAIEPVVECLKKDNKVEVCAWIGWVKYDLLLTGTEDQNGYNTREAISHGKANGIPTLAVMDFWSNYNSRFELYPDKIAIIDEQMRQEMLAAGFPDDILVITGQPAFDKLETERKRFHESDAWPNPLRYAARRAYGMHPYDKLIIFMSQPISALGYDWGYTEHDVIPLLIDALAEVAPDSQLLIKPHPREDPKGLYKYEREFPHVKIRSNKDIHDLMMSANLVVGMNSVILVEACYLGCQTVSLQPGLKGKDLLPWGIMAPTVTIPSMIPFFVKEYLLNEAWRKRNQEVLDAHVITEPAAPKVAKLVYEMVGIE